MKKWAASPSTIKQVISNQLMEAHSFRSIKELGCVESLYNVSAVVRQMIKYESIMGQSRPLIWWIFFFSLSWSTSPIWYPTSFRWVNYDVILSLLSINFLKSTSTGESSFELFYSYVVVFLLLLLLLLCIVSLYICMFLKF